MSTARHRAAALLLAGYLCGPSAADPAPIQPPLAPSGELQSSIYTVQIDGRRLPLVKSYEKAAHNIDRNRDKVLTLDELGGQAKDLPGDLRVDKHDYAVGLAHEFTGTPSSYLAGYPSAEEIQDQLVALRDAYPELVTLTVLGNSPEGRPITAVRLAGADNSTVRPKLVVVAQQHAREWMAHQVALATLRALLDDPRNADLLETFEFWCVPMANPDGYEYSRQVNPMWRKNRGPAGQEGPRGVDLNRNFAADFRRADDASDSQEDDWGASDRPYSVQFRGAAPASELETRYLQSLVDMPGVRGVVDVHGFGCKIVLPNPPTRVAQAEYQRVARAMAGAMGADYEVLRYRDLYPITGHLGGYADQHGALGITLEVGKAFQPDPRKIKTVASNGARGVLAFARELMKPGTGASL